MSGVPPRGGSSGRSVAPRQTLYKDKGVPQMWQAFVKDMKKFREDAGLTPQEVADLLGVSPAKVYLWENGKSTPHPHDLCVLLTVLGVKRITIE